MSPSTLRLRCWPVRFPAHPDRFVLLGVVPSEPCPIWPPRASPTDHIYERHFMGEGPEFIDHRIRLVAARDHRRKGLAQAFILGGYRNSRMSSRLQENA